MLAIRGAVDAIVVEMGVTYMGVDVECEGRTIWSPSLRVGYLFYDEIKALEKVVNVPSGVTSFIADMIKVDEHAFDEFVRTVLAYLSKTNNAPLLAMSSRCVEIAIALRAEITGCWPEVSGNLEPFLERSRRIMGSMEYYL